jgi:uncharacterized protein (DUF1697 family)
MPVFISLLRGINVGGHRPLKMSELRDIYEELGHERVQSYVQSGNLLFWSKEKEPASIARRIEQAIEKSFGFAPDVILRTRAEMEAVITRSPFAERKDIPPSKLLVTFFERQPDSKGVAQVNAMKLPPEEFQVLGRELYVYFPDGVGRSKFPAVRIGKMLKAAGTARNWNTVLKLLEMATEAELAG